MAIYQDRVKTLRDILLMSPEERKREYRVDWVNEKGIARHIDKVTINGNVFTDYQAFSFLWEKSYVKSPVRSGDGSIGNLNSYATFLTPHLKIDFGLMSIDSYRKIMQLIYSGNEFLVTCYDVVNNKDTTNKMYFSTEEMPKLWTIVDALNGDENAVMLLGIQDYSVEMIGTNADLDLVTVNYYLNSPTGVGQTTPIYSEDVSIGSEIVLGAGSAIDTYTFDGYDFNNAWHIESASGTKYNHNYVFAITKSIIDETSNSINFYSDWRNTNTYNLIYNYGLSTPMIGSDLKYVYSKMVVEGESIGDLPTFDPAPSVIIEGKKYYPYYNGAWYKTPVKAINSVPVSNGELYWGNYDSSIYLLYDIYNYRVTYFIDGLWYGTVGIQYNADVPLPELIKEGYSFDGWYKEIEYQNKFSVSEKMPPYGISLYARWVKEE